MLPARLAQLSERSTTPEGFDASFATNVLGTTALTQRLLPALVAGAPSRVVFVSSGGMYTQPLDLSDMQHAKLQPWDGSAAYAKEKRCQVALAEHLADAWAGQGEGAYGADSGGGVTNQQHAVREAPAVLACCCLAAVRVPHHTTVAVCAHVHAL